MGEKQNYTNEVKLNYYKKGIMDTIFSDTLLTIDDFYYLKSVIPEYVKMQLGLNNRVGYTDLGKSRGLINLDGDIFINSKYFDFSGKTEDYIEDMGKVIELFNTVNHECAHYIDERESLDNNNNRFLYSEEMNGIMQLARVNPEKTEDYKTFVHAYYYSTRSETFARKFAECKTQEFVNDLKTYKQNYLDSNPEVKKEVDKYYEQKTENEEIDYNELSEEAVNYIINNSKVKVIQNKQNEIKENHDERLEVLKLKKETLLPEVKKDFDEVCEQYSSSSNTEKNVDEVNMIELNSVIKIPEFYDKQTAQKLYEAAKNKGQWATALGLSDIKDLNIDNKEKEDLHKKIAESVVDYQYNQRHEPTKNNLVDESKFTL